MDKRPVIILAFANSMEQPEHLKYLAHEIEAVQGYLGKRDNDIKIVPIYSTTINKIHNEVSEYRERLVAFMYSGHSGQLDIKTVGNSMSAIGLAEILGECLMLKVVLINGCLSSGHLPNLLEKQIPILIATEAPINDQAAANFSAFFWESLSKGDTVTKAFDLGLQRAQYIRTSKIEVIETEEAVRGSLDTGQSTSALPWILILNQPDDANWSVMAAIEDFKYINEFKTNKYLTETLYASFAGIDKRKVGARKDFRSAKNLIYSYFPQFITKYIYDLCAEPTSDQEVNSKEIPYFTQPDLRRLKKIADFYLSLKEVLKSIALAEIREQLIRSLDSKLPKILSDLTTESQWSSCANVAIILAGIEFLKSREIIIKEFTGIDWNFLPETDDFFAEMRTEIDKTENRNTANSEKLNPKETRRLCELAEIKITHLLKQFIFLKEYQFVTIKNITVYKNRVKLEPSYGFDLSIYEWIGGEDEPPEFNENILDNAPDNSCILIVKKSENMVDMVDDLIQDTKYLNLSPFLIDNNVLYDKDHIPDISFCAVSSSEGFIYKQLIKPSDREIYAKITKDNKNSQRFYDNLKKQFVHFDGLIANQDIHGSA